MPKLSANVGHGSCCLFKILGRYHNINICVVVRSFLFNSVFDDEIGSFIYLQFGEKKQKGLILRELIWNHEERIQCDCGVMIDHLAWGLILPLFSKRFF